jgi:hypothetical protein
LFGGTYRRRLLVAFAASIAAHEIFAGIVPGIAPHQTQVQERVDRFTVARIEKRPKPTPTPVPTPKPTPKPQVLAHARIVTTVQPTIVPKTTTGKSAHKERIKHAGAARPKPPKISHAKPIWDIPTGGQGAGAGKKVAAGSLGNGLQGTGAGDSGNGEGAGESPCGSVYFQSVGNQPPHLDRESGLYVYDKIRMSVHMADGSVQDIVLDYPWRYRNESGDPFLSGHNDVPMVFQWPPKEIRTDEPPLVQYVMTHTTREGFTELNDCSGATR